MGIKKWLGRLSPEKKDAIYSGIMLIGAFTGFGSKAIAIVTLLESFPGRVKALKRANTKIDELADELEAKIEVGEGETPIPLTDEVHLVLTVEELLALDDWKDLQGKGARELKKLAKKVHN